MIKCPNCGSEASDSAKNCAVCTTPLPRPSVATAVLTPPVPPRAGPAGDAETVASPFANPFSTGGAAVSLVPGQTFGQRYQIIGLLGVGGMGAVYHVWDSELGLSLALKVIKPDSDPLATQELERRFKRELVLARQVTHTNVIRIHDLGEIDGIKYITMPFVHGTDLARLLAAEGKLPVLRALSIARQIVSGLRAAHEVGIVHRDLKPANILIDDDKAVITDFGIARSTSAGTFATAAGAIIGTLAYMAPEQATGRPVDQRADIYAFGLILSEMLIGKRGSSGGDTALALLIERATHAPSHLRAIDPSIPEPLDKLVAQCLEPDPAARYKTTKDLEEALDRLDVEGHERHVPVVEPPKPGARWPGVAAAIALGLVIGLGAWVLFLRPAASGPTTVAVARAPVSVLIADFDNQAKDPVFTGSLEQALSIAIEGASFITTYSRTAAQDLVARLKQPGTPLDQSAARLVAASEGIKVVLTGSVETRGSGYVLTVRAIDSANGNELGLARETVTDKGDVLKGVQSVASKLRDILGDTTPESVRLSAGETVTTTSLEALQSYSIAQDLSSSGKREESIEHYRNAIRLDKDFGRAYSGLATVLFNTGHRPEATELWKQSLSLMDRMTEREKYRTLGLWFSGPGASYEQAIENFEKLVALYPADRAGQSNLAFAYFQMLDFKKAMEHGQRSVELYPKNARSHMNYAIYAMFTGDLKIAETEARTALELGKGQYKAYLPLAAVAFASADTARMRAAYEGMRGTGPLGASMAAHGLADLAMYEGRWVEAEELLQAGLAADEKSKDGLARAAKLIALAEVHLAQNRTPQAVRAAQDAMSITREDVTIVPAALVLVRAGRRAEAQAIASELGQKLQRRSRAYGAIVEGEIARAAGRSGDAKDAFERAQKLADLWLGRFLLGVTYIDGAEFLSAQAELDLALKRRGEATAVFLDDVPSFRYLAPLPYWLGRAQEGVNKASPTAGENYKKFLSLRPADSRDPLALDARKRLAGLSPPR
jgi:serine/threonine protein kinase/tetratricopeptide (TPR) repeat protein